MEAGNIVFLIAGMLAALAIAFLLWGFWTLGHRAGRGAALREAEAGMADAIRGERADAVRRSRAIVSGQAAEQLAPWLPAFPWDPSECRFVGKPIDFIVFCGAAAGRIEEVVFVEVKTGSSGLSAVERSLREAVAGGRVRYAEYHPDRAGGEAPRS